MTEKEDRSAREGFSGRVEELAAAVDGTVTFLGEASLREGTERPALLLRCTGVEDVVAGVRFGRTNGLPVSVGSDPDSERGGGVIVDLSQMKRVDVDAKARVARVEAGATAADVDRATQRYGLATPTGVPSTANVVALSLKGGVGWLRRQYGTLKDNTLALEMVTADGRAATYEAGKEDLLRRARTGVVTALTLRLHPVGPEVVLLTAVYALSLARKALYTWRDWTRTAPSEASTDFIFWMVPAAPPFPPSLHNRSVVIVTGLFAGGVQEGLGTFRPLREVGERLIDLTGPAPYVAAQRMFDPFLPEGVGLDNRRRHLLTFDDEHVEGILSAAQRRPAQTLLAVRHLGRASGGTGGGYLVSAGGGAEEGEETERLWNELAAV